MTNKTKIIEITEEALLDLVDIAKNKISKVEKVDYNQEDSILTVSYLDKSEQIQFMYFVVKDS